MTAPREASSVILLREAAAGFEVLMLRRRQGQAWSSAFVFPGGALEPDEAAPVAGARELFEEAGILLARSAIPSGVELADRAGLRRAFLEGRDANAMLAAAGLTWRTDALVPWSHWITPSTEPGGPARLSAAEGRGGSALEPGGPARLSAAEGRGGSALEPGGPAPIISKRFSARFFVCELPPGQESSHDDRETVEQLWIAPALAVERAGELNLPPPQVRTCWELRDFHAIGDVLAAGRARGREPHPIMPRLRRPSAGPSPTLLLPWDPDYTELGTGDATPMASRPSWACGPSRFVREGNAWRHTGAPGLTPTA